MSSGVGAVTALVEFGEVWTPIMLYAFQDYVLAVHSH
jgi:hypothetical protein